MNLHPHFSIAMDDSVHEGRIIELPTNDFSSQDLAGLKEAAKSVDLLETPYGNGLLFTGYRKPVGPARGTSEGPWKLFFCSEDQSNP